MGLYPGLWMLGCLVCVFCSCDTETDVSVEGGTVVIKGHDYIATTNEHFICATLDWYPPDKCDYGNCSWGNASLLRLDLKNVFLLNAVKAFSPLKIRLGGSLQDRLVYQTHPSQPCVPFIKNSSTLFGFNEGCLPLARWDELNSFFREARALVIFGLNALRGKVILRNKTAIGSWNSTNAASLIRYTVRKGYHIFGWELGNELSGKGIRASIDVDTYASDTIILHNLVKDIYKGIHNKPKIIAPGGFFDYVWFKKFISKTNGYLDVITQHIYNLGPGDDKSLTQKIMDPTVLNKGVRLFRDLRNIIRISGHKVVAWAGEAGGVHHSGRDGVSNTYMFSFWYLDQLGMAAMYGTKTYCRQSLVGGNYGLLNTTTFVPNPDYYSALLWHRLMGKKVLQANFVGPTKIRAYAHCAKHSHGVTILLINIDDMAIRANVSFLSSRTYHKHEQKWHQFHNNEQRFGVRKEYHLSPMDGDIQSQSVLLNGKVLTLDSLGTIPSLEPILVNSSKPIVVAPYSIAFVHMPCAVVPACG